MTHIGENYDKIRGTGVTTLTPEYNSDRLRGEAPTEGFKWRDRFNQDHKVQVSSDDPEVTVIFPVSNGEVRFRASDIDNPGDSLSTSCSYEYKWCEAVFHYESWGPKFFWQGAHVWARCTFYKDNEASRKCSDYETWKKLYSSNGIKQTMQVNQYSEVLSLPLAENGLTQQNRLELLQVLNTRSDLWRQIGNALKVSTGLIQGLATQPNRPYDKLDEVLLEWFNTECSPVTWDTIIQCVKDCGVPVLSKDIQKLIK